MAGKAGLDVPTIDTPSHCSSASSLHHFRVCAMRLTRCLRLSSLPPSSVMYNFLSLLLTFLGVLPRLPSSALQGYCSSCGLPFRLRSTLYWYSGKGKGKVPGRSPNSSVTVIPTCPSQHHFRLAGSQTP